MSFVRLRQNNFSNPTRSAPVPRSREHSHQSGLFAHLHSVQQHDAVHSPAPVETHRAARQNAHTFPPYHRTTIQNDLRGMAAPTRIEKQERAPLSRREAPCCFLKQNHVRSYHFCWTNILYSTPARRNYFIGHGFSPRRENGIVWGTRNRFGEVARLVQKRHRHHGAGALFFW